MDSLLSKLSKQIVQCQGRFCLGSVRRHCGGTAAAGRGQSDAEAMLCPPSTVRQAPVVKEAKSLARYNTAPTISDGSPARPSGIEPSATRLNPSDLDQARVASV